MSSACAAAPIQGPGEAVPQLGEVGAPGVDDGHATLCQGDVPSVAASDTELFQIFHAVGVASQDLFKRVVPQPLTVGEVQLDQGDTVPEDGAPDREGDECMGVDVKLCQGGEQIWSIICKILIAHQAVSTDC